MATPIMALKLSRDDAKDLEYILKVFTYNVKEELKKYVEFDEWSTGHDLYDLHRGKRLLKRLRKQIKKHTPGKETIDRK